MSAGAHTTTYPAPLQRRLGTLATVRCGDGHAGSIEQRLL